MSDRTYRLILGALLLIALYFELKIVIYFMVIVLFVEGVTNWRIPVLIGKLQGATSAAYGDITMNSELAKRNYRFEFDAERVWRLLNATMLLITYVLFYDMLWFFPWFMGFAVFGAGASGVCPMLIACKWVGFK